MLHGSTAVCFRKKNYLAIRQRRVTVDILPVLIKCFMVLLQFVLEKNYLAIRQMRVTVDILPVLIIASWFYCSLF